MASFHGPSFDNLRKQAKALLRAWQRGDSEARDRVAAFFPNVPRFGLQAAQLVLAREYGFRSWSALARFVPRLGHFDDIATFRVAREFDVKPERLWDTLSKPEEIGAWLLPVSFEPRTGAPYAFRSQPAMTGTVGEYSPQRAIRFDSADGAFWRFAIEPLDDGDATRIRLTVEDRMTLELVEGFPGGVAKAWNPGVTAGWHEILDALELHLTGRQPPDIDYPRLCRFYDRVLEQLIEQGSPRVDQR
ncbi:MAG: hypothetical protein F4029_03180 [Gammaproteobacteria bacterium]|nr:hypothetical protein [Gammaproteobacteria bacterium]MYK45211.1 hypothetical protein [Gammaproteobacteria bacterium]